MELSHDNLVLFEQILTGPSAALVICLMVFWWGKNLIQNEIIPSHEKKMDGLLDAFTATRNSFDSAVKMMHDRLIQVEVKLDNVNSKVDDIQSDFGELTTDFKVMKELKKNDT